MNIHSEAEERDHEDWHGWPWSSSKHKASLSKVDNKLTPLIAWFPLKTMYCNDLGKFSNTFKVLKLWNWFVDS